MEAFKVHIPVESSSFAVWTERRHSTCSMIWEEKNRPPLLVNENQGLLSTPIRDLGSYWLVLHKEGWLKRLEEKRG